MAEQSNRFGGFIVDSLIGEGGMGKVFRARQVDLDRWVALKVLPRARENKTFVERFYREARSAARLVHPNIIQIYTVDQIEEIPFFAMELVEGDDLEHLVRPPNPSLTMDETIEVIRSVGKALMVAAEQGIVHRDIKPANVMITRTGLVKVMDFGLAKGIDNSMTQAGLIVGTPAYMSPEQGASKPVDTRSDIYSLGCVMYEVMAGQPPFQAENVAALIYKHMYENPPAFAALGKSVNPEIEKICFKMMAKNVVDRFQTPRELLEALSLIPSNSSLSELSLAKRAEEAIQKRKQKAMNKTMVTPEGFLGLAPKDESTLGPPASAGAVTRQIHTPPPVPVPPAPQSPIPAPRSPLQAPPPAAQARPPVASPPASTAPFYPPSAPPPSAAPAARPSAPPAPVAAPSKDPSSAIVRRPAPSRPQSTPSINQPVGTSSGAVPSTVLFSSAPASGVPRARSDSSLFRAQTRMDMFQKLPDSRWTYRIDLGRCALAEGLAADLPALPPTATGLGDCLLCSNWNKRTGCAVAVCQDMERSGRYKGLKLLSEQSLIWAGCGRFDRALDLLDTYIKNFPEDPEGYRELARLYDRPDYRGRDKRRMIVLYQRFAELAKAKGTYTPLEITRAEERAATLSAAPPESKSSLILPGEAIAFHCFYRSALVCFGYGLLTQEGLTFVRAGEVDPESGIVAADMGGAVGRATTIFRRFKSEQAKKEEQAVVKRELSRLSELSVEALQKEVTRVLTLTYEQMTSADMSVDTFVKIHCISIKVGTQSHQLLFTEGSGFKAEQVNELVKRKLLKLGRK
jgi:serine/threonine-protein kinase